jgi:hypothetical protein
MSIWDNLTFSKLIELSQITENTENGILEQIQICYDLTDEAIYDLSVIDLLSYKKNITQLKYFPNHIENSIKILDEEYHKIKLDELTLGEWIDLDNYLTNNFLENSTKIMNLLYRRIKIDEWSNKIFEPNIYEDRSNIFNDINVRYFPINEILDFRKNVFETFTLNNDIEEDDENDDENDLTYQEKARIKDEKERKKIKEKFQWEKLLINLSNDNLKLGYDLLNIPVLYIFNMITLKNLEQRL